MTIKLSDAQWGALDRLSRSGPLVVTEILLPPSMDGARKTKLLCSPFSIATLKILVNKGLVSVSRGNVERLKDVAGKFGRPRRLVTIKLTFTGKLILSTSLEELLLGANIKHTGV